MLTGGQHAVTSNRAAGCTSESQSYQVTINEQRYHIWDTAGLNETEQGTVTGRKALDELRSLFQKLSKEDGVHLLVYCVAGQGFRDILRVNHDLVAGIMCQGCVPTVIVVTKQENAEKDEWWDKHGKHFKIKADKVPGHACVTTTKGKGDVFLTQYQASTVKVRDLMKQRSEHGWKGKPKWWSRGVQKPMARYLDRYRNNTNTERDVLSWNFHKKGYH